MLSKRVQQLQPSPIRKYNGLAAKKEAEGVNVLHLNIGQPDIDAPDLFFEALNSYPSKNLPYASSQGINAMLEAQSKYYKRWGLDYKPEEIFITAGCSEAIQMCLVALCDRGDGVMVFEPYYTNYSMMTATLEIEVHAVTTSIDDNYAIPDMETLEKACKPNTKCILVNNPCNPTGHVFSKEEMQRVVDLAKEHNLIILADEVYREFNFSDHDFLSFADFDEVSNQVVLLDSASKKYACCGARIGSIATHNEEILDAVNRLCQTRLSVSTLEQYATAKLADLPDSYFDEVAGLYEARKTALKAALQKIPDVKFSDPEGAFYTLVKLPVDSADKFVGWMLGEFVDNNETVLPTPAEGFYSTPGLGVDEIRISYCIDEKVLARSVEIIDIALNKYPGSKRK